jgi:myo-inositol-1(or 4)-monophosphatase
VENCSDVDDQRALDLAKRAAFRAGRLAMARLGQPGYLTWKGRRDVVPEAALEVQASIVSIIQQESAGDAILTEEGPEDEPLDVEAERLWIVDPICGSLNFAHGIPFFGVSIALRVGGQLRVGVVHDPMRDETFAARSGEPATLNDRPITIRTQSLGPEFWEQAIVGTDLPHDGSRREEAVRAFQLISAEVLTQNIMGSPALGLCYVAAGRLDAYWTFDAKPWDVAAACVVIEQAGGLVTDADGGSWLHSDGTYLAATPTAHTWAVRELKFARERAQKTH